MGTRRVNLSFSQLDKLQFVPPVGGRGLIGKLEDRRRWPWMVPHFVAAAAGQTATVPAGGRPNAFYTIRHTKSILVVAITQHKRVAYTM